MCSGCMAAAAAAAAAAAEAAARGPLNTVANTIRMKRNRISLYIYSTES